jgi:hypothetical protein
MLFCANNSCSGPTRLNFDDKKPNPFTKMPNPFTNPVKSSRHKQWFDEPIKNEFLIIGGKEYKNIDAFLDSIKVDSGVNTEKLRPGMKRELVKLYERALEHGFKFRIFCGYRTKKHNDKNKARADAAGRSDYVAENSLHKKGLAVDIKTDELTVEQKMMLGNIWEQELGHPWGWHIQPKEIYHFPLMLNTKEGNPIDKNGHRIILNS